MNKSSLTNFTSLMIILAGHYSPIYKEQILSIGYFALSGAITNWLAIHMLFEKVPGLYGSGVIPSRFKEFKEGIKNLIMHEFFSSKNLENFYKQSNLSEKSFLDKIDYEEIYKKLVEAIKESSLGSMLEMVGGEKALEPLREPLKKKIGETIKDITEKNSKNIFPNELKDEIESIIDSRLSELSPEQVKIIVKDIIHKHLGWLVVWGGVFGFIIGLLLGFLGNVG